MNWLASLAWYWILLGMVIGNAAILFFAWRLCVFSAQCDADVERMQRGGE